jgi:glycosyltransferase domain-containing protein
LPSTPSASFTLIVPTYNRPEPLGRLLRYLSSLGAEFPVLVLDSGSPASQARTGELIGGLNLNVRHLSYDSRMVPFEKFWRGSMQVETEFCSLCGDDDVVMVAALAPLIDYLVQNPEFAAAHGYYFTFYQTQEIGITSVVYASPSLDHGDPLRRLRDLFSRYQAITYGLYRTSVMQMALSRIQPLGSMLGCELLAGALTAASGKIARLPLFYYGRSLSPSEPYTQWHPLEWLLDSPDELFREYVMYRAILADFLLTEKGVSLGPADLWKVLDYTHLCYLSEYVRPDLLHYLGDQVIHGASVKETMQGLWPRLAPSESRLLDTLRRSRLLRRVRDRLKPELRLHNLWRPFRMKNERIVSTTTAGGEARNYRLYRDFLFPNPEDGVSFREDEVAAIIRQLDAYP